MKAAFARAGEGIDSIRLRDAPKPQLASGEALLRLTAATLNYRDLLVLGGTMSGVKEPEYIPLSDAVGEVVEVSDGVTRVKPGDRVSPLFAQDWLTGATPTRTMLGGPVDGVARQLATFDAESLCLIPEQIDDLAAAALPCAGLTAWSALFGARPLQPGEWVLVQGTGGVSLAALQWATAVGARVVATSSSDAKLERARSMGADITINYRATPDWADAARSALGGSGVDIVVDVVGANQLEQCARALADGGVISAVGLLAGAPSWGNDVGKPVIPIGVGNRDQHEAMLAFCAEHAIQPVVDNVFDFDGLKEGLRLMESGEFFGKIGINLG